MNTARSLRARGNARLIAMGCPTAAEDVADHLAHQLQTLLALADPARRKATGDLVLDRAEAEDMATALDELTVIAHALKPLRGRGPAGDGRQGRRVSPARVTSDPTTTQGVKKNF